MKTCGEIRAAVLAGEPLAEAELVAHTNACPACAAIVQGGLGDVLRAGPDPAPADVEGLLRQVEAGLRAETGLAGWMRSRRTWVRRALALAVAALIVIGTVLTVPRPDLADYPRARMALALGAWGLPLIGALLFAIRPAHRPSVTTLSTTLFAGASLAALVAVSALPPPVEVGPPHGDGFHVPCFLMGLAWSVVISGATWLVDQGTTRLAVLIGATAGGLLANVVLQLHCPGTARAHLLCSHVGVAAVAVAAAAVVALGPRRAR